MKSYIAALVLASAYAINLSSYNQAYGMDDTMGDGSTIGSDVMPKSKYDGQQCTQDNNFCGMGADMWESVKDDHGKGDDNGMGDDHGMGDDNGMGDHNDMPGDHGMGDHNDMPGDHGKGGDKADHGKDGMNDGGDDDKLIMEKVIKPLHEKFGIKKETIEKVSQMTDCERDVWCADGHKDFCAAVESEIRELMGDHEEHENDHSGENGKHGPHYDHGEHGEADKIIFEQVVKPIAGSFGLDKETMEKVGKMTDEEFKTWCADGQQEFCDTLKEVTASFIADFEGNHGGEDDNGDNDPTAYLAQKRSKKEGSDQRKAAASKIE